jgi:hypothetical protein
MGLYADYVATLNTGNAVHDRTASAGRTGVALFSFVRASAVPASTYVDATTPLTASLALTPGSVAVVGIMSVNSDVARPGWVRWQPMFTSKIGTNLHFSAGLMWAHTTSTRDISATYENGATTQRMVGAIWA